MTSLTQYSHGGNCKFIIIHVFKSITAFNGFAAAGEALDIAKKKGWRGTWHSKRWTWTARPPLVPSTPPRSRQSIRLFDFQVHRFCLIFYPSAPPHIVLDNQWDQRRNSQKVSKQGELTKGKRENSGKLIAGKTLNISPGYSGKGRQVCFPVEQRKSSFESSLLFRKRHLISIFVSWYISLIGSLTYLLLIWCDILDRWQMSSKLCWWHVDQGDMIIDWWLMAGGMWWW